jgi:hypothetical protein
MKARLTKQEAIDILTNAGNMWPKTESFFAGRIRKISELPDDADVIFDDYELSEINCQPRPYEGAIIVAKDGLKGVVDFVSWSHGISVKWQDHKWYRSHCTWHTSYGFFIDESREFWRLKSEN